jgi:hypothetical protein
MRLIDADALLEKSWDADTRVGYVQVVDVGDIEEAPTIEAEHVKHGKWVKDESRDMLRCSVCKNFCVENWYYWLRYCPDCGAKMDK